MIRKPCLFVAMLLLLAGSAGATADGPAVPLTSVDPALFHPFSEWPGPGPLPGVHGAVPSHLTALGDRLFFAAADPGHGPEPWISDGTVEGTFRLADAFPGEGGSDPVPIGVVESPAGPRLLFWASSPEVGREPWVTDGTAAGTRMLVDLSPGAGSSFARPGTWWREEARPSEADPAGVLLGGELYFGSRRGLHATDGTEAGTRSVGNPCGPSGCTVEVSWLAVSADRIWFLYEDGSPAQGVDWQLGSSDGTASDGTAVQLHDTGLEPRAEPPLVPHGDGIAMAVSELGYGQPPCSAAPLVGPPPTPGIAPPMGTCIVAVTEQDHRYEARLGSHFVTFAEWRHGLVISTLDAAGTELWIVPPGRTPERLASLAPSTERVVRFFPAGDILYLAGDQGSLWRVAAATRRPEGLGGPVQQILPPDLTLLDGERPLWAERFEPVVTPPASEYFWDLKSWTGAPFQRFVAPQTGPGNRERFPLAPRMEPVGDRLFLSADAGDGHQLWVVDRAEVDTGCLEDARAHCLRNGRFEVRVRYANQHDGGTEGDASPVAPHGSGDTGYFWFFRPDNLELAVKVLDGRPVNGHWWVVSGGTTDLEYELEVVDRVTDRVRTYRHAPGDLCSVVDTAAFREEGAVAPPVSTALTSTAPTSTAPTSIAPASVASAPPSTPVASHLTPPPECDVFGDRLACVGPGDRFSIQVDYENQHAGGETGPGLAYPETADTATVRFFPNGGTELLVKVLDGRPVNGHWWVFWGGLTNLGYTVRVLDRETEEVRTFTNPPGSQCGGADTTAFAAGG